MIAQILAELLKVSPPWLAVIGVKQELYINCPCRRHRVVSLVALFSCGARRGNAKWVRSPPWSPRCSDTQIGSPPLAPHQRGALSRGTQQRDASTVDRTERIKTQHGTTPHMAPTEHGSNRAHEGHNSSQEQRSLLSECALNIMSRRASMCVCIMSSQSRL